MIDFDVPQVDPTTVPVDNLTIAEPMQLSFEGFQPEAFAILERLREHPHIDQYQDEKPGIYDVLKDPFKCYRDDLVVNWVLPNRLDFETEKNVFSRLLKNDFGAGGCHDNLWMSFYRLGRRRLTDVQLSHSIFPDGFRVGLYVGSYGTELLAQALDRIAQQPERFLDLLNPLLDDEWTRFYYYYGSGQSKTREEFRDPLDALPDDLDRAKGLWVRTYFPKAEVLAWEGRLVRHALEAVHAVWPIYRFFLHDASPAAS